MKFDSLRMGSMNMLAPSPLTRMQWVLGMPNWEERSCLLLGRSLQIISTFPTLRQGTSIGFTSGRIGNTTLLACWHFPHSRGSSNCQGCPPGGETVIKPAVVRSEESAHGKYINYNKTSNKYNVIFRKDGKSQHHIHIHIGSGSFPTQEEAVIARDDCSSR